MIQAPASPGTGPDSPPPASLRPFAMSVFSTSLVLRKRGRKMGKVQDDGCDDDDPRLEPLRAWHGIPVRITAKDEYCMTATAHSRLHTACLGLGAPTAGQISKDPGPTANRPSAVRGFLLFPRTYQAKVVSLWTGSTWWCAALNHGTPTKPAFLSPNPIPRRGHPHPGPLGSCLARVPQVGQHNTGFRHEAWL